MDRNLIAEASVILNVPCKRIWEALTKPEIIKRYFFGADIITTWVVGSPILYRGEWQGKAYEDKGTVLAFEPEKRLVVTHWSPLSGVPDTPEHYHTVTYELKSEGAATRLTLTQDNNSSEEERLHSEQNWRSVLDGLKQILQP